MTAEEVWTLRPLLLPMLQELLGNADDMEDTASEACVRVIKQFHRIKDPKPSIVKNYLFMTAKYLVIDFWRARRVQYLETVDDMRSVDDWDDTDKCLSVLIALDKLRPTYREALQAHWRGETKRVTAENLGISHQGLKFRVLRAQRELGQLVRGELRQSVYMRDKEVNDESQSNGSEIQGPGTR